MENKNFRIVPEEDIALRETKPVEIFTRSPFSKTKHFRLAYSSSPGIDRHRELEKLGPRNAPVVADDSKAQ